MSEKLFFSQWNPSSAAPFIKQREGLRLKAYQCSAHKWTVGYGHTRGVHEGMTIDLKTADKYLLDDIQNVVEELALYVTAKVTQGQFIALVSLAFNVGVPAVARSHTLQYLNDGQLEKAKAGFLTFNKVNGVPNTGLTNRRRLEVALMRIRYQF